MNQNRPAPTVILVMRLLCRISMKNNATSSILAQAIMKATTGLNQPRSTNYTMAVVAVSANSAAKITAKVRGRVMGSFDMRLLSSAG